MTEHLSKICLQEQFALKEALQYDPAYLLAAQTAEKLLASLRAGMTKKQAQRLHELLDALDTQLEIQSWQSFHRGYILGGEMACDLFQRPVRV